jgi:hypothetical protein
MTDKTDALVALIDRYWDLAYAEGKEGRSRDTENGDAQTCWYEINKLIRALAAPATDHIPDAGKMVGQADALVGLVAACENAFAGELTADEPDDEDVSLPPSGITFGMIRRAREALAAQAPAADPYAAKLRADIMADTTLTAAAAATGDGEDRARKLYEPGEYEAAFKGRPAADSAVVAWVNDGGGHIGPTEYAILAAKINMSEWRPLVYGDTLPPAAATVPEWQLVPKVPTEAMLAAGVDAGVKASPDPWCPKTWAAMLAAAPTAPAVDEGLLPDTLVPHATEWYRLCERRFHVDRITISGELAEAIVAALAKQAAHAEDRPASMYGLTHGRTGPFDHTKPPPGVRPDSHGSTNAHQADDAEGRHG